MHSDRYELSANPLFGRDVFTVIAVYILSRVDLSPISLVTVAFVDFIARSILFTTAIASDAKVETLKS